MDSTAISSRPGLRSKGAQPNAILLAIALGGLGSIGAMASASAGRLPVPTAIAAGCTWKTSDIIDKRIDVSAQKSLMRAMSKGGLQGKAASAMISAIKKGKLAGIYLPPRKAVSDRGKMLTPQQGYWQMIPPGANSVCLKKPGNLSPMIIYRENLSDSLVDAALASAWKSCGTTPDPVCGYEVDVLPPECTNDKHCIDKKLGNLCFDYKCETVTPPPHADPVLSKTPRPREDPKCWYDSECVQHGEGMRCIGADPKEKGAGRCKSTAEFIRCHARASDKFKKATQVCSVAAAADAMKCTAQHVGILSTPFGTGKHPLGLAWCVGVDAWTADTCEGKARDAWIKAQQRCEADLLGTSKSFVKPSGKGGGSARPRQPTKRSRARRRARRGTTRRRTR